MLRTVAIVLALAVAATALSACFRTGVQVGPNGAGVRTGIPINL